ncbi:hypothetical protein G7Y79_00027g060900 [Physcia stellaris]|nr:hypothetical protein G7Y79_00027g060900 [Physcia stellaris]
MNPAAPTWASAAISGPAQVTTPPPTPQQDPPVPRIDHNKYGQRVDSTLIYDKESVKKIRGLHLCVNHYLRECTYGDSCTNRHDVNLNKNDLHTLRVVARQQPCRFGTGCDDPLCTYGHRCPMEREGSRECFFGADCRFPVDMHGIDLKIVRTTKVGK